MKKTGKKLLAAFFAVALLLCALPVGSIAVSAASSGDLISGDYVYRILDDGNVSIIGYVGNGGRLTIPGNLVGRPVTMIDSGAFQDCTGLTSVSIPDSVQIIENSAFSGCTGLPSITIPGSVKTIGARAFNGCSEMSTVTLEAGIMTIEQLAYSGCSSLKDVNYTGSQEEWNAIEIGWPNDELINATKHYHFNPSDRIPGDFDGNGSINIEETQDLYTAVSNGVAPDNADLNNDAKVDIIDSLLAYLIASGKKVA